MAASYSLHKRILPKLLFDDSTIDDISNLPCVKKGPSVIILPSSKNNKSKKAGNKFIAVGRCFHVSKRTTSESFNGPDNNSADETRQPHQQQLTDANTDVIVRKKLTNVINRVKMDRERDKLKEERNRSSKSSLDGRSEVLGGDNRRKLNIASVKSVGRTLFVPITLGGQDIAPSIKDNSNDMNSANTAFASTTSQLPQNRQTVNNKNENNSLVSSIMTGSGGSGLANRVKFSDDVNNNNNGVNTLTSLQRQPMTPRNTVSMSRNARMAKSLTQIEHPLPYANMEESELTLFQMTRRRVYRFVTSPWFEFAVTIFILLNTVFLAIEHHNMDKNIKMVLSISNHVSTRKKVIRPQ